MTRCPRRAEVEAAHDGRLDAAARAAIAQHQRDCEPCRAAAHALAALGPALATLPVPASDALATRRQRNRLLAAFEQAATEPAPVERAPLRRRASVAALALAAAAAAVVVTRSRPSVPPPPAAWPVAASAVTAPSPVAAQAVTVVATSARWSRHDEGGLTVVQLEDGELELQVAHGATPHRLVVHVPDGDIDDVGTAFHVRVAAAHTSSVEVREGAVVVRRTGQPPVFLSAGDRWIAEPTLTTPVASAAPLAPVAPALSPIPRPPVAPPREPARNAIAAEFRRAVALLDAGRDTAAVAALRSFMSRRGDDPRAEDASYLLVLALQRTGDAAATQTAARAYLKRYPGGFRRAQVEALAQSAP